MRLWFLVALLLASCAPSGTPNTLTRFEPQNLFAFSQPGHYLTDHDFDDLTVEVISCDNASVTSDAVDVLLTHVRAVCNKPLGVQLVVDTPFMNVASRTWDDAGLKHFRDGARKYSTTGRHLVLNVLAVPGYYAEDSSVVAGITWTDDSFAVFPTVFRNRLNLEGSIMTHEFGHILGLVDGGTPDLTGHGDGGGHCSNPRCVMYFASGSGIADFDYGCLHDLGLR